MRVVERRIAAALDAGGVVGSVVGVRLLGNIPVDTIRVLVLAVGLFLSAWMYAR